MTQKRVNYLPESSNKLQEKFISHLMTGGKKTVARAIMEDAWEILRKQNKKPEQIFEKAMKNVMPTVEVRPKRVGGAVYQVPVEVKPGRQMALSMRWILQECRKKKGGCMAEKLAREFSDAASETGGAFKKKLDVQKMAEANKAFAHFARY